MDKIKINILEDGTVSIDTDNISPTNHMSADEFISKIETLVGIKTETRKKARYSTHTHKVEIKN